MEELKCKVCGKLASEDNFFIKKDRLCNRHYQQYRKHSKFLDDNIMIKQPNIPWTEEDISLLKECYGKYSTEELITIIHRSYSSIIAKAHRLGLHKDQQYRRSLKHNYYKLIDNAYKIYTGDNKYYTIIDIDDYEKVKKYYWSMDRDGYFYTSFLTKDNIFNKTKVLLHKFVISNTYEYNIVDHINQKRYDNRKNNLRISNHKDNCLNRGMSDGILRIQDNLWRCYDQKINILCEGSYAECKKALIRNNDYYDLSVMQEQAMYQIPGLFELLSEEDKKKCFENLQQKYAE